MKLENVNHGTGGYRAGCRCEECKEAVYAYYRGRYARNRAAAIELLGGKCVNCGTTESLEFDHIDPTTKKENYDAAMHWSEARRVEALKKAQLLCKACHASKSSSERWERQEYKTCPQCCGKGRVRIPLGEVGPNWGDLEQIR